MVAIQAVLFFVAADTALTVCKCDTATIIYDISAIGSDIKPLTASVNP